MQLSLTTNTLFNESPINFIRGTYTSGPRAWNNIGASSGGTKISLTELFNWDATNPSRGLGEQVWMNVGGWGGAGMYAVKAAGIRFGFRFLNRALSGTKREANKVLKMGGLANEVRF